MSTVLAYLDAGSGSMILQAILGGAAGVFVAIKMFGIRVKNAIFFWRKDDEEGTDAAPSPPAAKPTKTEVKTPV
jgi:hypothetical protein